MKVFAAASIFFFAVLGFAFAQESPAPSSRALAELLDKDDRPVTEVKPDPEVMALVRNILSYSGLEMNFVLESAPGTKNAYATVRDGQRILVYDPAYLDSIADAANTDWARLGVLAHEIGHHVQGHLVDNGHQAEDELAADRYAGFVLGVIGASLKDAQAHQLLMSSRGSASHPPKANRLEATKQGWERAQKLVLRRDGTKDGTVCPIVRLSRPAQREAVFALALEGDFVATKLVLKWGADGTVWGAYDVMDTTRKLTGHVERDGSIRLEQFSGCVVLGKFDLKLDALNKSNETWKGVCTPHEGKPFPALLISATPGETRPLATDPIALKKRP